MRMQPDFEKANEIYFRLGIIYKQQQKYHQSLEVFSDELLAWNAAYPSTVLQIYCDKPAEAINGGRYLVSDRTCSRAAERREFPKLGF